MLIGNLRLRACHELVPYFLDLSRGGHLCECVGLLVETTLSSCALKSESMRVMFLFLYS